MSNLDTIARLQMLDILLDFRIRILEINNKHLEVANNYNEKHGLVTVPVMLEEDISNLIAFLKGEL